MDATVLGASAPNGLPTKSPAVHIEPASSSPEHLPSTNAETEIRHTSEPDDIREHPTAVSPPVNGAHAVSSARRKDHYQPVDDAYSTRFATKCHPDAAAVRAELDAFFGEHWPWPSDNAREKFLEADLHGFVCWAYPFARSDRIVDSAKVMTLFFLLDDLVEEELSLEDGKALYKRLITLAEGRAQPDRTSPHEWITYDVFAKMRAVDQDLTEAVTRGMTLCVTSQLDEERERSTGMRALLQQRCKEAGASFISTLMAYGLDLRLSPSEVASITDIEESYAKLGIVVNEITSYDKEVRSFNPNQAGGGTVLNMVQTQADDTGCSVAAAKRILWVLCREWELEHLDLVARREASSDGCSDTLKAYMKGLEYIMGGNEVWSGYTPRYQLSS
ncbi:MAG: hypothetical protein LQ345_003804 [Seirophora villosa]|nr:MAG: hypothetical protein LQ345_003804 [Seirophora villosa]